jgi:hypothetical protein
LTEVTLLELFRRLRQFLDRSENPARKDQRDDECETGGNQDTDDMRPADVASEAHFGGLVNLGVDTGENE